MLRPAVAATLSWLFAGLGEAYVDGVGAGLRRIARLLGLILGAFTVAAVLAAWGIGRLGIALFLVGAAVALGSHAWGGIVAARRARARLDAGLPCAGVAAALAHVVLGTVVLLAGVAAYRTVVVQAFRVPSGSMAPTLEPGDHILVNKLVYGAPLVAPPGRLLGRLPALRAPAPGDVVVLVDPKDRSKTFVKRVAAVAGQTIELRHGAALVDGRPWDDAHRPAATSGPGFDVAASTVPPGTVYVLGDDRARSYDSRFFGPVPLGDVLGEAIAIYFAAGDHGVRWDRIGRRIE